MTPGSILREILNAARSMSWVEWSAVLLAVASVLYARANHIGVYPTGILSVILSIYLFTRSVNRLYPDAALNGYYLIMSVYGWYLWTPKDTKKRQTPVSWSTRRDILTALGIFLVLWVTLFWWLSTYRINNVPFLDSFSSALAACGMWLLARRKVENWLALLVADAVDIPLFFIKKLYLFCLLNIFYVVIAWMGYLAWKRIWARENQAVQN